MTPPGFRASRALAAAAVALVAAGCAAAPDATHAAGPPDGSPAPAVLAYTFELRPAPDREVRITLAARASAAGRTVFALENHWGGVERPLADLARIEARGADGSPRTCTATDDADIAVDAAPAEPLALSWSIRENTEPPSFEDSRNYRPILDGRRFHLLGPVGLFIPAELADSGPVAIGWRWQGFAGQGWSCITSFGDDPAGGTVSVRPAEFRHAVFLAGDVALERRLIAGRPLCIAVERGAFDLQPRELADLAARIVSAERGFFGDFDVPFYLISAIAVGRASPTALAFGGTGLTGSFAMFLQPGMTLDPASPQRRKIEQLLAHEMFHNWWCQATPLQGDEALCYWFTEGFTDFYARRMLLRSGLTTLDEYAQDLERSLQDYARSPVRASGNAAIAKGFWSVRDLEVLPYRRGDLVAVLLDGAIRRTSGGARSLDDFIREGVRLGREGQALDTGVLLDRVQRWCSADCADRVRDIVENGAELVLEPDVLGPCLTIADGHVRAAPGRTAADCPDL